MKTLKEKKETTLKVTTNEKTTAISNMMIFLKEKVVNTPSIIAKLNVKEGWFRALGLTLFTALFLVSCNSSGDKVENAENNLLEATQNFDEANEEYLEDVEDYREDIHQQIEENNQHIVELNALIDVQKEEDKDPYKQQIAELEAKNAAMKTRMDTYTPNSNENWEMFKAEFSKDMSELGEAFKNLVTKH